MNLGYLVWDKHHPIIRGVFQCNSWWFHLCWIKQHKCSNHSLLMTCRKSNVADHRDNDLAVNISLMISAGLVCFETISTNDFLFLVAFRLCQAFPCSFCTNILALITTYIISPSRSKSRDISSLWQWLPVTQGQEIRTIPWLSSTETQVQLVMYFDQSLF